MVPGRFGSSVASFRPIRYRGCPAPSPTRKVFDVPSCMSVIFVLMYGWRARMLT